MPIEVKVGHKFFPLEIDAQDAKKALKMISILEKKGECQVKSKKVLLFNKGYFLVELNDLKKADKILKTALREVVSSTFHLEINRRILITLGHLHV